MESIHINELYNITCFKDYISVSDFAKLLEEFVVVTPNGMSDTKPEKTITWDELMACEGENYG